MTEFRKELEALLNRHSIENDSDTPDYILAGYLLACLRAWNQWVPERDRWYGRGRVETGAIMDARRAEAPK